METQQDIQARVEALIGSLTVQNIAKDMTNQQLAAALQQAQQTIKELTPAEVEPTPVAGSSVVGG